MWEKRRNIDCTLLQTCTSLRENSFLRNKFILCNKEKELPYWIEIEDVLAGDKNKGTARKKKKKQHLNLS